MIEENGRQLYQKILWKSRRGMLELDLLLAPFVRQIFPQLEPNQQRSYCQLLAQEDTTLYKWLALAQSPHSDFVEIVDLIRSHAKKSAP